MDKLILVIDDNDQTNVIEELVRDANRRGIDLSYRQFNVGSPKEPQLLTEGKIDIEKVKAAYKERFKDKGLVFNMIVCDWDLSDEDIDGAELLRRLGNECFLPTTPRILYSSLLREKLEEQLNKYDKDDDATKEPVVKYISSLVNGNYLAFIERDNYPIQVISHLMNSENIDFILDDTLRRYPDFVMATGHGHNLEGKTFLEVAQLLQNDKIIKYDFKRNIIQEVIQYLTEKQKQSSI